MPEPAAERPVGSAVSGSRTRVALFGGSFDPPHVAHQMVCLLVLETAPVDEVWMVPTFRHAFAKELTSFAHRRAMCERAAALFGGRVRVSDIEAELASGRVGPSRTLDTLRALAARDPEVAFRLVLGADILAETDKWYRWSEVVALAPPIVIGRRGYDGPEAGDAHAIEVILPNVSSSEIRTRIAAGRDAMPLVPRAVMDYIAAEGLYR